MQNPIDEVIKTKRRFRITKRSVESLEPEIHPCGLER